MGNNDSNENPYDFKISGIATGGPDIRVNAINSLNFIVSIEDGDLDPGPLTDVGMVDIGTDRSWAFDINNTGTANLVVTSITSSNPAFEVTDIPSLPETIPPGFDLVFDSDHHVRFTPTVAGEQTTIITILSNDPDGESTFTFALKATGRGPDMSVGGPGFSYLVEIPDGDAATQAADGTSFGGLDIDGESVYHSFRIRNDGNRRLRLLGATITGPHAQDFQLHTEGGDPDADFDRNIQSGDHFDFSIEFDPSAGGTRSAEVRLISDDPYKNPYTFAIDGIGVTETVRPSIVISGPAGTIANGESGTSASSGTDFGSSSTGGQPITRTFHIANASSQKLNLFAISTNHPSFLLTRVPETSVASFGGAEFDITFTPTSAGVADGVVTVLSDDPLNSSYTFAIRATATGRSIPAEITDFDVGSSDITIQSAPGLSYKLTSSANLAAGTWQTLPGYGNIITTGSPQQFSLIGLIDVEAAPRLFIRLEEN